MKFDSEIVKINHSIPHINKFIDKGLDGLYQSNDTLDGKTKISDEENQKVLEKIVEASRRNIRIDARSYY